MVEKIAFRKIDVISIDVQVHIAHGLPIITIFGLSTKATIFQETIAQALA